MKMLLLILLSIIPSTVFAQSYSELLSYPVPIVEYETVSIHDSLIAPNTNQHTIDFSNEKDNFLTWTIAQSIMVIHENQSECESSCTSIRGYRENIPDMSEFVVTPEIAWMTSRAIVNAFVNYDVPVEEIWATSYQESRFRTHAIGGGRECGMLQQTTNYIRWSSSLVEDFEEREEVYEWFHEELYLEDEEAICMYLLEPSNALWHFGLKYHHEVAQNGENWSAHYNSGSGMWRYQDDHNRYLRYFNSYAERVVREYLHTEVSL